MVFNSHYQYFNRSGPQDRSHTDRYTYIRGTGWFVYLRGDQEMYDGIEVNSGIAGPFNTWSEARVYLKSVIKLADPDFQKGMHRNRMSRRLGSHFT